MSSCWYIQEGLSLFNIYREEQEHKTLEDENNADALEIFHALRYC